MFDPTYIPVAQEVARKVVATHKRLFDAFPEVGDDDLVQECLTAIIRGATAFDTAKAAWATCAGRTAHFRLIDFHRQKVSQRKYDAVANNRPTQLDSVANLSDEIIHIAERAATVAESMMPEFAPTGPHRFTLHQLAACIALQKHLGASWRGIVIVLETRADVRERIGLRRIPTHTTLYRAEATIRRTIRQMRKEKYERTHQTQTTSPRIAPYLDSDPGTGGSVDGHADQEPVGAGSTL